MPIEHINIEKFWQLHKHIPVIDVRSPAEFLHAHIPGAYSLALFDDHQRKVIGTAYKKESRQIAVNIGLNYFSERMKKIPPEAARIFEEWNQKSAKVDFNVFSAAENKQQAFLIHCWRGGMRSGTVAWLLSLYGNHVYVLEGGYKSFRNWVLQQFEKEYSFKILGGFTGSGKTDILRKIQEEGGKIIDLERLAAHKGSAFGSLGEKPQPSQEMFENQLAIELGKISNGSDQSNTDGQTKSDVPAIWLEDECRNIGMVNIPEKLWSQMRRSPLYFLDIPFEERLNYIVSAYGNFQKKDLAASVTAIQKRLGGIDTKNAIDFLMSDKPKDSFSILIKYYDKVYSRALTERENIQTLLNKISCDTVDEKNSRSLL